MAGKTVKRDSNRRDRTGKYRRHAVIIRNQSIAHNYTWMAGLAVIILMLIICSVVTKASAKLEEKNAAYDQQIDVLNARIEEEQQRRADLETRAIYITTKQFVEEFAREKLGLVYEDELIFRPSE